MTAKPGSFTAPRFTALWLSFGILSWSLGCAHDRPEEPRAGDDENANSSADESSARPVDAVTKTSDASMPSSKDATRASVDAGRGATSVRDAQAAVEASSDSPDASDASDRGDTERHTDAGGEHAPDAGSLPPLNANLTLHMAGDSTSAIFPASDPTHRVGWASVLQPFFTTGVRIDDAAQSGRSSKSFLDEGLWNALKAKIVPGDYVFVEFGHNDEKSDDPARYADPSTTFRANLKTYVSETRAAGGVAVLLTPISRRQFSGSKIVASHGAYPAAVSAVAAETGTPLIDMTEKTRILLESIGPTGTVELFATNDNTHLSAKGAQEVAKLAVQAIRELNLPLAERLSP